MQIKDVLRVEFICASCLSPETIARRKRVAVQIERLLAIEPALEPWQRSLVNKMALRKDGNMAPREADLLDDLVEVY